jgi:carbonic anhydrase
MKKTITLIITLIASSILTALAIASSAAPKQSADDALKNLLDGNKRFINNNHRHTNDSIETVKTLASGQSPYAIILTCSDSRLPPELLFDTGIGEVFVVRVAGNTTDQVILGSVEYAAEHLGTPLVMVLGHEKCGAVKATVEAKGKADGNIGSIVKGIAPAYQKALAANNKGTAKDSQFVEAVADANIALVKANLTKQSTVLKHLVDAKKLKIVAAKYHIDHGLVQLME